MSVSLPEIAEIVAVQLGLDEVDGGARLAENLGAGSADLLNVIVALEDRYGVEIGEEDAAAVRTVADLQRLVGKLLGRELR